jgi:putative spermidine/putrescine transport system ATP-binding protein
MARPRRQASRGHERGSALADPYIRFERVTKAFGALTVVDQLDLDIARGEFVCLLGPSGSGKTTLLMMLAGFEAPTAGRVLVDGTDIVPLPPYRRNMGVVFQSYALFPHMTVAENVAFPLEMRGVSRADTAAKVGRALDMVQLGAFKERRPSQLSGGQQQRVALARALVFEPSVVLMDEPLGALDKKLREQMQLDIRALHRDLGLTIVFVTHDQSEALTMADRIAVFNHGKIEQIGPPDAIYERPATRFVADFIGESNLLDGTIESVGDGAATVRDGRGARLTVANAAGGLAAGQNVTVCIRPERVRLDAVAGTPNAFATTVSDCVYHGDHVRVRLGEDGCGLVAKAERHGRGWPVGAPVVAAFEPADCWVLPR